MCAIRFYSIVCASVLAGAPAVLSAMQPADPPHSKSGGAIRNGPFPKRTTLKTSDGVEIIADYYAPKAGDTGHSPAAILVHMYPAQRQSWLPLVPSLLDAGFAVLA